MSSPAEDHELQQRQRPAMEVSTRERGMLYRHIKKILMVVWIVLFCFFFPFPGREEGTGILGFPIPLYGIVPGFVIVLVGILCILGMIFLGKRGRRHSLPRFAKLESPPAVLYLRPFDEDTDFRLYASWGRDRPSTAFRDRRRQAKFEFRNQLKGWRQGMAFEFGDILQEITRGIGNVAAIGEPGSPPIVGADNVYVSDDNWQEKVLEMARGAEIVILTAGTTPGVVWEIENMIRIVPPTKLILNIPGMTPARRRKNYMKFRESLAHLFPKGLPKKLQYRVLTFDDDWNPVRDSRTEPPAGTAANVAWWMTRVLP